MAPVLFKHVPVPMFLGPGGAGGAATSPAGFVPGAGADAAAAVAAAYGGGASNSKTITVPNDKVGSVGSSLFMAGLACATHVLTCLCSCWSVPM